MEIKQLIKQNIKKQINEDKRYKNGNNIIGNKKDM